MGNNNFSQGRRTSVGYSDYFSLNMIFISTKREQNLGMLHRIVLRSSDDSFESSAAGDAATLTSENPIRGYDQ